MKSVCKTQGLQSSIVIPVGHRSLIGRLANVRFDVCITRGWRQLGCRKRWQRSMAGKIVKVPIGKLELFRHFPVKISRPHNQPRPKIPPSLNALLVQSLYTFWLAAKLHHDLVQISEQLDCLLRIVICPELYSIDNVV